MNIPKYLLRKNYGLEKVQNLIRLSNEAGMLTRQEIVSMLPPLLADIQSHHSVFDMCAAPGSKTAQALELIMSQHMKKNKKANVDEVDGFVIANDASSKRAFMLTHQMNRLNTANISIVNHFAQNFPFLVEKESGELMQFDRVMCDVPCSSDAAIRKLPQKWLNWDTKDSIELHPIQLKILQTGLELLKVGGKIAFSTCSLNPIEDEAVVAAVLKQYGDKIKILETGVEGFKFEKGLTSWKVMTLKNRKDDSNPQDNFTSFDSFDDVTLRKDSKLEEALYPTMFSSNYSDEIKQELRKCLRVLPHYQDTSGFFITVITKVKEFDEVVEKQKAQQEKLKDSVQKVPCQVMGSRQFEYIKVPRKDPDMEYLMAYYGLSKEFPVDQLIAPNEEMKKIYFVTKPLMRFMSADHFNELSLITMGCEVFIKNKSKHGNAVECIYRIAQDGIMNVVPYMTKRIIRTRNAEVLK
mmetsp:Transcript_1037/g.1888  ORF Transcript_1037/g.1888 Transcript_1037/m.1888 type:complete len:466 (+) Transcript_1037:576-1973(+)